MFELELAQAHIDDMRRDAAAHRRARAARTPKVRHRRAQRLRRREAVRVAVVR